MKWLPLSGVTPQNCAGFNEVYNETCFVINDTLMVGNLNISTTHALFFHCPNNNNIKLFFDIDVFKIQDYNPPLLIDVFCTVITLEFNKE